MEPTEPKTRSAQPRVVMIVANHFLHDTRVYKQARSLIEWGCEVHVVAMANSSLPLVEETDGILVHRVNMRRGDIVRLGAIVLSWWCRPMLRRALAPSVRAEPLESRQDHAARSTASAPRSRLPFAGRLSPEAGAVGSLLWRLLRTVYRASLKKYSWARNLVDLVFALRWQVHRALKRLVRRVTASVLRFPKRLIAGGIRVGWAIARRNKRVVPPSLHLLDLNALRLLARNLQFARHAIILRPDVVQSHDLNALLGGMLAKRLTEAPLVYDSHELFLKRNIGNKSRARDNLIWAPIERFCISKCDAVLSVAEGICEYLAKQYDIPKPHLIRNVQPFERPAAKTKILADELGIPLDRRIVIYAGAITFNRGLESMIESALHLNNAAYVLMGYARNPEYLDSLKQQAEELGVMGSSVFFREAVPIEDVIRYVASADLGIVPTQNVCLSYFFESSNKIFHCVMAGVPVAMSDHREKRLLVEEYGIGVLFDETDPAEIARVVNRALDDRETYAQLRRNCLEAARVLNWEHEEHKLRTIFAELIGDRAAPVGQVLIAPACAGETQSPGQTQYVATK